MEEYDPLQTNFYGIAKLAKQKGISVIGLAGKLPEEIPENLKHYFDMLISINKEQVDVSEAIKNTTQNLVRTSMDLGNNLLMQQ